MTTASAPAAPPETVAASLFVDAFNSVYVYEDDPRMTIAVHLTTGSSMAVTGRLGDDYHMHFSPAEVSAALAWLTHAVATDPRAVIAVIADRDDERESAHGWAWFIDTGDALPASAASSLFPDHVELLGAEQSWVTLRGPRPLVDTSADGLAYTALTDDVKAVVTAHGKPGRPAAGHRIALRLDSTVTVHIDAADVPAARDALEEIEHEDFDVDLTTRDGHVIGHITLGDADGAELVSVDDVPADELSDDDTD
ncbi:hypothetical protein AB0B04_18820 [Streptomyces xinghaiensis]|uniref:Uncharacterized protein n=2 Tax=Streptomyces TaxID=1883 RepID=A0A420UXZ8_9ACTN|nr:MULTISPECIES: hypothetical protein [Streptomyces]KNE81395.1 hypothetical protein ADZ36_16575 [Streptomyces fradiae]OFA48266.1 hypothetical protein BEN35_19190 [Streptomyces fradiae]PQM20665.1 hypothetical protein Sfr7A_26125 [Streptomyces xinghaiensis]RKM92605.1 hypothetical protein SFRA_024780 [Streptomyces xinghaiensis]RNC70573.1 hypothetical protein DC095_025770 [Streptomyces xinghaiensis]